MVTAIVLAAGVGSRMKSEKAKQFLEVAGHEVLYYSLRAFDEHPEVDSIVLVTKEEFVEHCQKELAERYQFAKVRDICIGGKERYDSVYQGLSAIGAEGENDIVLIHDGARPFVTAEMISASIACARECGACTVGVPAKDTIKIVDTDHYGVETRNENLYTRFRHRRHFRYHCFVGLMRQCTRQKKWRHPQYNGRYDACRTICRGALQGGRRCV